MGLPTQAQIFRQALAQLDAARRAVGDARDELNSDWPPGSPDLPPAAVKARAFVKKKVDRLENEIDGMKSHLYAALEAIHNREGR